MKLFPILLSLVFTVVATAVLTSCNGDKPSETFTLATFAADVTPPVGHMLFTGRFVSATEVETPLEARGFVLVGSRQKPLVVCAVDWSEIRNETYDLWRDRLAKVAGTDRERVLVSAIHQHDTPLGDLGAERILRSLGSPHQVINPAFHEKALGAVEAALEESLSRLQPATHFEVGEGKVEKIASNRRYELADGIPSYDRGSACKNLAAQRAPEGVIDPFLKSISFWNEETLLTTYSVYATHPMSYYGTRKINADFPGIARARRQADTPNALQIYASGCSGNVTAGKYNDGSPENRSVLAERLYQGMKSAAESGQRFALRSVEFRNSHLALEPRKSDGFSRGELEQKIRETSDARSHLMASLGLSWLERIARKGGSIDLPVVDFNQGKAQLLLLPGEIYVEYQLFAQETGQGNFVMTPAYGESAPGYIPLEQHWKEGDSNLKSWCWVDKGMEKRIKSALRNTLRGQGTGESQ